MSANSSHSRGASTHSRGNLSPKPSGAWGKGTAAAAAAVRAAPPPPAPANAGLSPVPPGTPANRVRAYSGGNVAPQGTFASASSHHRRKRFSHPNPSNKGAVGAAPGRGGAGGGSGGGGNSQHQRTGGGGGNSQHQRTGGGQLHRNHAGGVGAASPGGSWHGTMNSSSRTSHLPPHIASSVPPPPSLTPSTTPKQHGTPKHHHHHHHHHKKRDLLLTGQGSTAEQRAVQRFSAEVLLQFRLSYLDPPEDFSVPEGCAWTSDPTRVAQIEEMSATKRQGGEVSKVGGKSHANNVNTTAPPLEECAPLQVNEETRWKAKIFAAEQVAAAAAANSFSAEDMFAKALLVLNKLSWTTMDKLSQELMNLYWEVPFNSVDHEVQSNNTNAVEVLRGIIRLIVQKAQAEPHFAGMYAQLCATLHKIYSTKTKEGNRNVEGSSTSPTQQPQSQRFLKKLLLEECQEAFHQDSMQRLQEITQNMTEPDEIAYHANLIRKHYVGLMRFLGELYCRDMIKIDIMIWCLKHLLQLEKADELSTEDSPAPHNHDVSQRTVQETSTAENLALQQVDNNSNDNDGAKTSSSTKSRDEIEVEEEKLECFAKLITTIGSMLEQQALGLRQSGKPKSSLELQDCWEYVYLLAGRKLPARLEPRGDEANGGNIKKQPISPNAKVSNRLKFMLQDLIEMKENGWVSRRAVDTPKTISELHQDVANEAAAAQQQARRSSSSGNLRAAVAPPTTSPMARRSSDGRGVNLRFRVQQQVAKPGRGNSATALRRSVSDGSSLQRMAAMGATAAPAGNAAAMRTEAADPSAPALPLPSDKIPRSKSMSVVDDDKFLAIAEDESAAPQNSNISNFMSPEECGDKMKKILREYFVAGDTDDAALSVQELVGAKKEGSIDRGAKMVEGGVLLVLEMKAEQVQKLITLFTACAEKGDLEKESFEAGLLVPLEFLSEIEIDAPLAGSHLVAVVAELCKLKMFSLDLLRKAPEMFLTEGKPARFAANVVKACSGSVSGDDVKVIEDLMTDEDRAAFPSAAALLSAAYESTA